ncbi:MAG: response regulator [Deltaproteobacteria bacterium]|jgi:CheY-like chemotaxis protein|nr:response regulator [Deltaproteobacteria bacterium]
MKLTRFSNTTRQGPASSPKQSVLYVEDEDVNWEVTEFSLRTRFSLSRAKTSEEAFQMLKKNSYDLILMDIQLMGSELNGIEITQVLRGLYDGKPPSYTQGVTPGEARIIFVTAYSARYGKQELLEAGGDDLMTKPVDFTRLSLVMSRMVVREAFKRQPEIQTKLAADQQVERRQSTRIDYRMDCRVQCSGYIYRGMITNISLGGARLFLRKLDPGHPLVTDADCQVEFTTAWGQVIANAKVVEHGPADDEIRISFSFIPPASESVLKNWLEKKDD